MPSYSEIVMTHAQSPRNVGELDDANAVASVGSPGRSLFMTMSLRIEEQRIAAARYRTFGCAPAIAAGSILTEMISGRSIGECLALTESDLGAAMGGVPAEKAWCVSLALNVMRTALANYSARDVGAEG